MRKLLAVTAVLFIAALAAGGHADAGGWAATSLDPLVAAPVAGEPTAIGFTIRQHGITPVMVDGVAIVVIDADGVTTRFAATPDGPVGHYVASVELPAPGRYEWSVLQGWFGEQDLGVLEVGSSTAGATAAGGDGGSDSSPLTVPLAVVAAALVGAGLFDLGRSAGRRRAAAA